MFLTTHYMDEAYHLADRICVIHRGLIVAEGTPDGLIDRYGGGNLLVFRECIPEAREALIRALPGCRLRATTSFFSFRRVTARPLSRWHHPLFAMDLAAVMRST